MSSHPDISRYLNVNGHPETHFLAAKELASGTADSIHQVLKEILAEKKIDPKKMVGLATDGASVMLGVRKGVTTK